MYDPTRIRISVGGTLDLAPFARGVVGNAPDPADVTPASGLVKYELSFYGTATVLVQMLDTRTIRVEVFPNLTAAEVDGFTASAQTYER